MKRPVPSIEARVTRMLYEHGPDSREYKAERWMWMNPDGRLPRDLQPPTASRPARTTPDEDPMSTGTPRAAHGPAPASDPFRDIPNARDDAYANTELETTRERQARAGPRVSAEVAAVHDRTEATWGPGEYWTELREALARTTRTRLPR